MSQLPIELHPLAVIEAREAREWYQERNEEVAAAFMDELDAAVKDIANEPTRWPTYLYGTRHKLFFRFPYVLVYRVLPEVIQILAVAHGRRKPGYWKARLNEDE